MDDGVEPKKIESTYSMQVNAGSRTVLMYLALIENVNFELERDGCNAVLLC